MGLLLVKISFKVAVFALLGRAGGVGDICCLIGAAAKGSGAERLCFLPLDCALCRLFRTFGEEGSRGVLLRLGGGGGAEREGVNDGKELE
jgi:hypothetical protein